MNVGKLTKQLPHKTYTFDEMRLRNGFYVLTNQVSDPLRLFYKYYEIELMFTLDRGTGWGLNNVGFDCLGESYRTATYQDFDGELTMVFKGDDE